jgi:hypothetical protein
MHSSLAVASRIPLEVAVAASYLQGIASEAKRQWLNAEWYYLCSLRELQRLAGGRNVHDIIAPLLRTAAIQRNVHSVHELRLSEGEILDIEGEAQAHEATNRFFRTTAHEWDQLVEAGSDYHAKAGHPFAMLVLNKLVALLCKRGRATGTVATSAALEFYRLWTRYYISAPEKLFKRVFGSSTPVALAYVTHSLTHV